MPETNSILDSIESLPNHESLLNEIRNKADNAFNNFNKIVRSNKSDYEKVLLSNSFLTILNNCLYTTGDLSMSRAEVMKELDDYYSINYRHSPALGKKLFLDQYFSLHKPYDKLKDEIWKSIAKISDFQFQHKRK